MAKAIFHGEFNHTRGPIGWAVKSSPEPQSFPRHLIEAGVKAGRATLVPQKRTYPAKPVKPTNP